MTTTHPTKPPAATDALVESMMPTAAALTVAVADRDDDLAGLTPAALRALALLLANHVDPDRPFKAHAPINVVRSAMRIAAARYRIPEHHALTRRDTAAVNARSVTCYVGHLAGLSSPVIGRDMNRDHTTVLNAWGRVGADPKLRRIATDIAEQLGIPVRQPEHDDQDEAIAS